MCLIKPLLELNLYSINGTTLVTYFIFCEFAGAEKPASTALLSVISTLHYLTLGKGEHLEL